MRLRHIMMLGVFVIFSILLPYIIEWAYDTDNPVIIWSYSQVDILNYTTAVLGVIIAMVALFLAIDENRVKIKFDIASTIDNDNDPCFMFRIVNGSKIYCKMEQFGFSCMYKPVEMKLFGHTLLFRRLKGQQRMHLVLSPPFDLQPNECHDVFIKYKDAKRQIDQLYHENEKVELFVSLVTWKRYYKVANEIRQLISDNYSETEGNTNE